MVTAREIRIDPDDWESVISDHLGPQLIVAGPGTGKTEFLVSRIADVINSGVARRDGVAVLTFSRRAAGDLRRRIETALGGSGVPVEVSTFHSLALRLLEKGAASGERPIPLTTPEQVGLVGRLLQAEDPDSWPVTYRGILGSRSFAAEIADFLMRCSERLLSPSDLEERARDRADWRGIPGLFRKYRDALIDLGRTDYGTLLVSAVEFLRSPEGQAAAGQFDFVYVDEYQDTSRAQAEMARLLASPHNNLTVTGDPYQSIYSFRGAELKNIAAFTDDHPDAVRIVLGRSFRVPAEILESALRIVAGGELPGSAGPVAPAEHAGSVETYVFDQETAEAEWIAKEIEHLMRTQDFDPSSIAILVRSKRELLNELSRALERRSIPHDRPDARLVDHPAIRLINDLATVAVMGGSLPTVTPGEASEADRSMRRTLLGPVVSAGLGREREILRARRRSWAPWVDVVRTELPGHPGMADLFASDGWATERPAADGFWHVWTTMSGLGSVAADPERADWRMALTAFAQVLERQAERDPTVTLEGYFRLTDEEGFEATPLLSHRPNHRRVTLTTLHQAKGLEFDAVFIANAVEGVFPDLRRSRRMLRPELLSPERTTDPTAQHLFQVQEEMRLAYTAMTRARLRVVWTATAAGVDQGEHRPSRFLVAASAGGSLAQLGPPGDVDGPPVTLREGEVALRRTVLDPAQAPQTRLASVSVLCGASQDFWSPQTFAGVPLPGPDKPVLGDKFSLSPSQADSYGRCPRRYVLERRLRLGNAGSPYAEFGSLVHEALELAEREIVGTGKIHADLEDALKHLRDVWAQADFGTPELNAAWLVHGEEALTKLYERWPSEDGIPVGLEEKVGAVVEGVTWRGIVDRVERTSEGLRVVDYKTSRNATRGDDAAVSIQLGFYAKSIAGSSGEEVVGAEMWFPRTKAKSVTTRPLDFDRLDEVEAEMSRITKDIRNENWEPIVSLNCKRCSFRMSCPAWPEGRGAYLP